MPSTFEQRDARERRHFAAQREGNVFAQDQRVAIPAAVALAAAGDLLDVVNRDGFDCASLGGYGGAANTFPTCRSRAALVGAVSVHGAPSASRRARASRATASSCASSVLSHQYPKRPW